METKTDSVAITNQAGAAGSEVNPKSQAEMLAEDAMKGRQLTPGQWRKLRGAYFTVKHKRMEPCGHRLDQINEPRNNCEYCWFAFFQTHGELVQTTDRAVQEQGTDFVDRLRGVKYRKMFLRFMSTIQMFKNEIDRAKGQDGQAGTGQGSIGIGEGIGQEIRNEGNAATHGEESGPVTGDFPDPITVV